MSKELPTVEDFVTEQIEWLNKFKTHWNENNKENPSRYPDRLPNGDWDEQFHFYTSCDLED